MRFHATYGSHLDAALMDRKSPTSLRTVGILLSGERNSGIRRYSETIAAGLSAEGLAIETLDFTPSRPGIPGILDTLRIVRQLRRADAVLVPYTRWNIWSRSRSRFFQHLILHIGLRRRTVTVLHDAYAPGGPFNLEWWVLALVLTVSGQVLLHSEHERRQLSSVFGASRAQVIPHFVVRRNIDRALARARLGISDQTTVIAMFGWIDPRKNYEIAIKAIASLPDRFVLWIIGESAPESLTYRASLEALSERCAVQHRVCFTGQIAEEDLDTYLGAVDIGVCPYREISASGSICTLLGSSRPIVASDVAFVRELRDAAPAVVRVVEVLDPAALARQIEATADAFPEAAAFEPIFNTRAVEAVADRYRAALAAVCR
jgi:glycosyltransferase involved in cell wall biosynthesis